MNAAPEPIMPDDASFDWIDEKRFANPAGAINDAKAIWGCGASSDLLIALRERLFDLLSKSISPDSALANLRQFLSASPSPAGWLSLFERDPQSLASLVQIFTTSQSLADRLIEDPESFDLLRQSDGRPTSREFLINELQTQLQTIESAADGTSKATEIIRRFINREVSRIAFGEFIRSVVPEKAGRQLAFVAEAVIRATLDYLLRMLASRCDPPQLPDGRTPSVTVIGLGSFGAEELSYGESLKLIFLYDRIDQWNRTHREYFDTLVSEFVRLLRPENLGSAGLEIDLRQSPKYETGTLICSSFEAVRIFETSGRTWQRIGFIKARVVAGDEELGEAFLQRLQPWVYRRFISRSDLAEIRTFRHKLERRTEPQLQPAGNQTDPAAEQGEPAKSRNVLTDPGGRNDIQRTIRFLQLLHGGDLQAVRGGNTYDAILALERAGCVTQQEASLLSENYARLCRLRHQLAVSFNSHDGEIPTAPHEIERLAWLLGIRRAESGSEAADVGNSDVGDADRFDQQLTEIFDVNRRMINHLMLDAPDDGASVADETELILDPDASAPLIAQTLGRHRLATPARAFEDLSALSTESVPFLSPHRCRHFFSLIAPALLKEISRTPDPDFTLASLVKVTDSLGAKATLWELLGANRPTMQLMVRLCAAAPYLTQILTENPGMIDELIDSLLMDRLPSTQRLDAQSIELCRGAEDLYPILLSFKHSAHLTIGVRNILGRESLAATQQAIGDTAEACLRRTIEFEQERLALRYGDPVGPDGEKAELITVGLGKLGGREPNYHSDLDAIFLYSADGETQRRVGGPRTTTTNRSFFNQLTQRVIERVNAPGPHGRLYELGSRLRPADEEGVLTIATSDFLKRFEQGGAPLWQWLAVCKARAITSSRSNRQTFDSQIAKLISHAPWHRGVPAEVRELRLRMQQTTSPDNLKRGAGGTVDVDLIAQMLTLRYARESNLQIHPSTPESLQSLADAGCLPEEEMLQLVTSYQTIRGVEINLRLMNTPQRHELPDDPGQMKNLAFLMNETDPEMIVAACNQARQKIRRLFDRILDRSEQLP